MGIHEDIFGELPVIEVIVRWHDKAISDFNLNNIRKFDVIRSEIILGNKEALFLKINDDEHKIIIPIDTGHIELYVEWEALTDSYRVKVNRKKKTRFTENLSIPTDKNRFIEATCKFYFIDIKEAKRSKDNFIELHDRVKQLEILPKTKTEVEREIWELYIEAQELLLRKKAEPFRIQKYPTLIPFFNDKGDVARYKLKFDLDVRTDSEYRLLEKELLEIGIIQQFDSEGGILLTYNDIFTGLDTIISTKFKTVFEREPRIVCRLALRPLSVFKLFTNEIKEKILTVRDVDVNYLKSEITLFSNTVQNILNIPESLIQKFQLKRVGFLVKKRVKDIKGKVQYDKERVDYESDSSKSFLRREKQNILSHFQKEQELNLRSRRVSSYEFAVGETFRIDSPDHEYFPDEFWGVLKRDLIPLGLERNIIESSQSIIFDFKDKEECFRIFSGIRGIGKFDFKKSPFDRDGVFIDDFLFKVQVNIISKKNEKQLFLERIEQLKGVEFHIPLPPKKGSRRPEYLPIGNLNGYESDLSCLVFNVPMRFKEERKVAKQLADYINEKKPIEFIQANLIGDQAKIEWLVTAMDKITNPSDKPNMRPVNERLGQFIFDSSKAEEVFKDISPGSEEWNRVKSNELLKLNDSQRKAILSALHSRDLCLLQGPPGTGKTTVIAELIWQTISVNQEERILLTSESNLAVDNALEKLLNKDHSLVKPIRFGDRRKFEEEGRKYSIYRIMRWANEKYEDERFIEDSEEEEEEDESIQENFNNNAVQIWMNRIAEKAHRNRNSKYEGALKNWTKELVQPRAEIKEIFRKKYFKFCNVIGSTCSSTGSPSFYKSYGNIFLDKFQTYSKLEYLLNNFPFAAKKIFEYLRELDIPTPHLPGYNALKDEYFTESNLREKRYTDAEDLTKLKYFKEEGYKNLISFIRLKEYTDKYIFPLLTANRIEFDTVIMDEASKATPPEMLLPLCLGSKSIVIGDHRQLPPMLNEKKFQEALISLNTPKAIELAEEIDKEFVETSQFERLILNPQVPKSIAARLNIQYRMHPQINNVIKQFYNDETDEGLNPAQELIDSLNSTDLNNPFSRHHGFWNEGFITPDIHTIWVNVDSHEELSGTSKSRINDMEVEAVKTVLKYLKNSTGFEEYFSFWANKYKGNEDRLMQEQEIGIISFYGHQVKKLQEVRRYAKAELNIPVRLKTVDKFQGMERNIIIVSTVRSNKILDKGEIKPNNDYGFAKSPERLNVALSRARRLLIVVGNLDFFQQYKDKNGERIYKNAIDIIREQGKIIDNYSMLNKYK